MTVSMLEMRQAAWLPALFSCNKYHLCCFKGLGLFLCVVQRGMLYIDLVPQVIHKYINTRAAQTCKEGLWLAVVITATVIKIKAFSY